MDRERVLIANTECERDPVHADRTLLDEIARNARIGLKPEFNAWSFLFLFDHLTQPIHVTRDQVPAQSVREP